MPIRSPISGFVARKSILPGQFIAAGTELYQIADLSTVWIVAELAEQDLARVAVGRRARLKLGAYPGAIFEGKVDFVYPAVNPETRTLEARMVFRNDELRLRPGMFGDVQIEAGGGEALVVPAEAVVDTGELQYVFVARGEGAFEPRSVVVGARNGDLVEIRSGLAPGDEVVTTANFYLDAESRLRAALEGHAAAEATGVAAAR
jgi:Cu(I)/Ag(I) efflux system membrane fusion protein